MGLQVKLGDNPSAAATGSEFRKLAERGFKELLDRIGVPILFNDVSKTCVAGPIDFKSSIDLVGRVPESSVRVDMLASDFDVFDVVLNETLCILNGQTMRILEIDRDPQDPCVRFFAIGVH